MGSANTIQMAGPSVLICYAVTGRRHVFIMRIMGEMLYQEPVTGSFATCGIFALHRLAFTACSTGSCGSLSACLSGPSAFTSTIGSPCCRSGYRPLAGMYIVAIANMAAVKYYGNLNYSPSSRSSPSSSCSSSAVPSSLASQCRRSHGLQQPSGNTAVLCLYLVVCWLLCASSPRLSRRRTGRYYGRKRKSEHLKRAVNNIVWRILIFLYRLDFRHSLYLSWNEVSHIGSPSS